MEHPERIPFRHPSNISLFNLYDKLNFPSVKGKTVSELIEQKSTFFEWALVSSKIFCLDDYTYSYIKNTAIILSDNAHKQQNQKQEQFKKDTLQFNEKYDGSEALDIVRQAKNIKLYELDYRLGFGQYANKTVEELIELSPSRLEYFIHILPWFGLTTSACNKLFSLEPNFIFLQSTRLLLMLKQSFRNTNSDDYYNNDVSNDEPFMIGDPRHDKSENPWLDVFDDEDEAEAAYWNTD